MKGTMSIGENLYNARKKCGLTQKEVAEKLNVSRQTLSKWESETATPDINSFKKLAALYSTTMDLLAEYDAEVAEIERVIENTSEDVQEKVDWNKMWGKRYPVLMTYKSKVDVKNYSVPLKDLIDDIKEKYGYCDRDAFLVLKDILAQLWFGRKNKK